MAETSVNAEGPKCSEETTEGPLDRTEPEQEYANDSDLPECERQQFAQYILSAVELLPKSSATQAMTTIRLFLQNWPGNIAKT